MAKQITFEHDGIDYVLEFSKRSVETMEKQGFIASELGDKPMSTLPALFAGAFIKNHRFTKKNVIDEIYAKMPDKDKLIGLLADMYNEPIEELLKDPDGGSEGNVKWTANW